MLSAGAGAVVVQHDGAVEVAQHDADVVQHDADEQQPPQAWAGVAASAPIEVVAKTMENNLNIQNSLHSKTEAINTLNSPGRAQPDRDIQTLILSALTATDLARIG